MTEWIIVCSGPRVTQAGYNSREAAQRAADRANVQETEPRWHVEYEGEPVSADPAKCEEQVNALARQEVPRDLVETILARLEAALRIKPQPAQGADHANRARISAAWKVINGAKKRLAR